eukprot:6187511-Pleurochrysis_carterae.AAC.4
MALMYMDADVVLAAIGTNRIVALLRAWHKVTRTVGFNLAIPDKRQAGTSVLWLGFVFVAASGVLFLPRDKALLLRTLAHATNTAALRKLCGMLEHVRGMWVGPPAWMHGLYHYLCGDPDPTAIVDPTPFMSRQLERWQIRLSHSTCTPLIGVATPLHIFTCFDGCGES